MLWTRRARLTPLATGTRDSSWRYIIQGAQRNSVRGISPEVPSDIASPPNRKRLGKLSRVLLYRDTWCIAGGCVASRLDVPIRKVTQVAKKERQHERQDWLSDASQSGSSL
jgi:hypothetical protein